VVAVPAQRLPWLKLWPESLAHEKIALLTDEQGWTWIHCLCAAAQQPRRWRFASVEHAAAVTGRTPESVSTLITARLLDERADGLWIHDYEQWQDRYPSELLGRRLDEGLTNTPRRLDEHSAKAPRRLDLEGRGEREIEKDSLSPVESEVRLAPDAEPARDQGMTRSQPKHPAIVVYRKLTGKRTLSVSAAARIEAAVAVGDERALTCWAVIVGEWVTRGYKAENVAGMLDWLRDGGPPEREQRTAMARASPAAGRNGRMSGPEYSAMRLREIAAAKGRENHVDVREIPGGDGIIDGQLSAPRLRSAEF